MDLARLEREQTCARPRAAMNQGAERPGLTPLGTTLRSAVEAAERDRIVAALAACDGNQTETARLLGIARRTLINKLEHYGLPRPRKRSDPSAALVQRCPLKCNALHFVVRMSQERRGTQLASG